MIGLFDSGSGGLTVLRSLRARVPQADVVYFGDVGNAPYGSKTPEQLAVLTRAGIAKLLEAGADDIVSACNSVSSSFLDGAFVDARFVEMTRPTARAMRLIAGARVLLLATEATVRSKMYNDALDPIVHLESLAIPQLASAIENGEQEDIIRKIVQKSLYEKREEMFDAVLLGCTHYPLVKVLLQEEARKLWGNVLVIDPADAVAEEAVQRFCIQGEGKTRFLISKDSEPFRTLVSRLFGTTKYAIDIV